MTITRKGLIALADGIIEAANRTDTNPHVLAVPIIGRLRGAGQLTPHFDQGRFDTYLDEHWDRHQEEPSP